MFDHLKAFILLTPLSMQAMKFGDLPSWALELSYYIREDVPLSGFFPELNRREAIVFPPELLLREPLFNQFIVNIYQPGEVRHDSSMVHFLLNWFAQRSYYQQII